MVNSRKRHDVSTCNISDAMKRGGSLGEFRFMTGVSGLVTGKAVTCRTEDGDWWAVVKAIESAAKGDVVVVESVHGQSRAVLGELLATEAAGRRVAAVVIDGCVRDSSGLAKLGLPIYARGLVPHAGNPEKRGKISVPLTINGVKIRPGDFIACDGNGAVAIPKAKYETVMAGARGIVEKEEKILKKMNAGISISEILHF